MPTKNIFLAIVLFATGCQTKAENNRQTKKKQFPPTIDLVDEWKKELIHSKQIGEPCLYESINSVAYRQWIKKNDGLQNGLPKQDKDIHRIKADLDKDGELDLFMYFQSENCSGHNGGTPYFAKIMYANGSTENNLMQTIQRKIIQTYNQQKSDNSDWKEISDDYLEETLTISYVNGIQGEIRLYTNSDAHCCPSYSGTYTFDPRSKKVNLALETLK